MSLPGEPFSDEDEDLEYQFPKPTVIFSPESSVTFATPLTVIPESQSVNKKHCVKC